MNEDNKALAGDVVTLLQQMIATNHNDISILSNQTADLAARVNMMQTTLETTVGAVDWRKVMSQVSLLEVRLTNLEKILEQIAMAVNVPVRSGTPYAVHAETSPVLEDFDPIGEASPGTGRRPSKRGSGTLKAV